MRTAEALARSLLAMAEQRFPPATVALYSADACVEVPFEPGECSTLGRADLIHRFAVAHGSPMEIRVADVVIHQTLDPHVVIAEYTYQWSPIGGQPFTTRNIQVVEEADGLIIATRDYHDHARISAGIPSRDSDDRGNRRE